MKIIITFSLIGLMFSQSLFAKGKPAQARYSTDYQYSHTVRDRYRGVDYDYYEYETCYERPRRKVINIHNRAQRNRGSGMLVAGAAAGITGLILRGNRDTRTLGNVLAVTGGALAVAGAVDFSNSSEIFYEHQGYECRSYYQVDRRRYKFYQDGYSCVTRRHYTHRWGGVHEYFVTQCAGRQYVTFNRHRNIWRYP